MGIITSQHARTHMSHKEMWRGTPWASDASQASGYLTCPGIECLSKQSKEGFPSSHLQKLKIKSLTRQNECEWKYPLAELCPDHCLTVSCWCCFALYEIITVPGAGFWSKWLLYGVHSQQQSCRALEKSFPLLQGLLSLVKPLSISSWGVSLPDISGARVSDKKSQVRIDPLLANAPAVPLQPCGCLHSCLCVWLEWSVLAMNKELMCHIWAVSILTHFWCHFLLLF